MRRIITTITILAALAVGYVAGQYHEWPEASAQTTEAITFAQLQIALGDIATDIESARQTIQQGIDRVNVGQAVLAGMAAKYGSHITAINTAAAANPSNVALQNAKAEAALLVAEYQAATTTATNIKTAIEGALP
jgi:hypothetical protein